MPKKFNITLDELKKAVAYADEHGSDDFGTITMTVDNSNGIGESIGVSKCFEDEPEDITNYSAF